MKPFNIFLLACFMLSVSCSTSTKEIGFPDRFDEIKIGDTEARVESIWGKGLSSTESYGTYKVRVIEFQHSDGSPNVFFSIDPTSHKVIGKSQWIDSFKLEKLLSDELNTSVFKTYVPCHTRSDKDKILVSRDKGLTIDIGSWGSNVVSWSTTDLLDKRVNLIFKTCPQLQSAD